MNLPFAGRDLEFSDQSTVSKFDKGKNRLVYHHIRSYRHCRGIDNNNFLDEMGERERKLLDKQVDKQEIISLP